MIHLLPMDVVAGRLQTSTEPSNTGHNSHIAIHTTVQLIGTDDVRLLRYYAMQSITEMSSTSD